MIRSSASMRAHFLQHVPFEDLGSIVGWLDRQGAATTATRFFLGEPLPDVRQCDLVIAVGGPMSVNDEAVLPWLKAEKEFLRSVMRRGIPVLGICLGAQLIANSLGARVYPNPQKEIGWFPIDAVAAPNRSFEFPSPCVAFHWHGETFELPDGAVRLARSAACENQAFQIGQRVIGLQFHLETTPAIAASLLESSRDEMVPGPYVQSEDDIRTAPAAHYAAANALMERVLEHVVGTPS
jgi:GMP synthase-like glutamine amidotransferase